MRLTIVPRITDSRLRILQIFTHFSSNKVETRNAAAQIIESLLILDQFSQNWKQIKVCNVIAGVNLERMLNVCNCLLVAAQLWEE